LQAIRQTILCTTHLFSEATTSKMAFKTFQIQIQLNSLSLSSHSHPSLSLIKSQVYGGFTAEAIFVQSFKHIER